MTPTATDKLAERLRRARELAGLTQAQAAKLLHLHRPAISEIEAGRRSVSAEELSDFSTIYGVDVKWLLGQFDESDDTPAIKMAARELARLKPEDFRKVMDVVRALNRKP